MEEIKLQLRELFSRIPRRHTTDNVKELYSILDEYEELLKGLEADPQYEAAIAPFFEALDPIRATVKASNSGKASKKGKDDLFDEASGTLKDSMEELTGLLA
jgi:flavodoxin